MNMYMYLATFVCFGKKRLFYSGFSNVRGHKPVSYVCLELNMAIQI